MSRIIAGSHRGRRLTPPPGNRTRPTTDRVREALFSTIASWAGTAGDPPEAALAGLAVCDLYAGSGAVGFEAASRGAASVLLVESDRRTGRIISSNAAELGLDVRVRTSRVEELAKTMPPGPFDVIFADPPYELGSISVDELLVDLLQQGWINDDALVVLERSVRSDPISWPENPADGWSKTYGETVLHFWQR